MVSNPYIILQARMNSERLPGKVMMHAGGRPMIGILIDRIKEAGIPILLATSQKPDNDILTDYAIKSGIRVFRGSEDNVLERYYFAAKSVRADLIFRLTGDNPLVSSSLIKDVFDFYLQISNQRGYVSTSLGKTWPIGISVEVFSNLLLTEAYLKATLAGEFEHVTPYMHQNHSGDIDVIQYDQSEKKYHYRLTVDTESDLKLFKILVEDYQAERKSIKDIIQILDNHPELVRINSGIGQKGWK